MYDSFKCASIKWHRLLLTLKWPQSWLEIWRWVKRKVQRRAFCLQVILIVSHCIEFLRHYSDLDDNFCWYTKTGNFVFHVCYFLYSYLSLKCTDIKFAIVFWWLVPIIFAINNKNGHLISLLLEDQPGLKIGHLSKDISWSIYYFSNLVVFALLGRYHYRILNVDDTWATMRNGCF